MTVPARSFRDCAAPFKHRPSRDMNPERRTYNRAHCMVRICVENAIRRVKAFRIMMERYRNRLKKYDRTNDIVCGAVNQAILPKRDGAL